MPVASSTIINPDATPLVPAVDQALKILIHMGNGSGRGMTVTEVCRALSIHKSKAYAILNTLRHYGFVEKDPSAKTYTLGVQLIFLGRGVLENLDIRARVEPFLMELAAETGNTALFGLVSAGQVFIIASHEGEGKIGVNIRPGHRFHITSGAHGKAIAAFMPEYEREKLLAGKNLFFYGTAGPDMKRLGKELAQCRETGYAADRGDLQQGINAVSSPVFGPGGGILGPLVLMGTFREDLIDDFGRRVAKLARRISMALGGEVDKNF